MTTRQRWTLVCTVIGSGAVFLDGTIVNAALKHIGQELPGTLVGVLEAQAYIVGGYLAVLAALLILAGALSDHYGRRPLNPPAAGATAEQVAASNQASMEAFHLAMLVCSGLLAIGALVSWYGLREGAGAPATSAESAAPAA